MCVSTKTELVFAFALLLLNPTLLSSLATPPLLLLLFLCHLSFESGRVLKARFDSFNLELEEYVTALGSLSVPDAALREQLRDGITYYFVPVCKKFFDAYAEVQFSKKHQEEYLRNSPKVLETKIGELFL
jgi:hypothetical protein